MAKQLDPPPPLTDEEYAQCLRTLQQLIQEAEIVEEDKRAYDIYQAAQKFYKTVKKNRKYVRKSELDEVPKPDFSHETSVRFLYPEGLSGQDDAATLPIPPASERAAHLDASGPLQTQASPETTGAEAEEFFEDARDDLQPISYIRRGKCYMCRISVRQFHDAYPSLCEACGVLNLEKRNQRIDLQDRIAVVTGARVKIGFYTALRLLRCGAHVIATTRFPRDAAARFAQQPDFSTWSERLHIYGLDLRFVPAIEDFVHTLQARYDRLDILINNAAQTVRRPPAYYKHLLAHENAPESSIDPALRPLLQSFHTNRPETSTLPMFASPSNVPMLSPSSHAPNAQETALHEAAAHGSLPQRNLPAPAILAFHPALSEVTQAPALSSAMLSQIPFLPEDQLDSPELFPAGLYDEDGQQEDNRTQTSWMMQVQDVPSWELWEVHLINALAPFLLLQRLEPMLRHSHAETKFVINVSATEGRFLGKERKSTRHPHTNMSKAALNMLTRTCAKEYANHNIFINSVDPGWISLELPRPYHRDFAARGFKLPIDAADAAARICDPIFETLHTGLPIYGKLFKDFREVDW